ncbi:MAG: SRPBCC family protein [Spirochaetota bacterium]
MIKKVLIILGIIIVVAAAVVVTAPVFLPKTYTVSRTIEIHAAPSAIYRTLGDFDEFMKWQPWIRYEPEAKKVITGKPFTIGARYEWEGKRLGKGSMMITSLAQNEYVETELIFGGADASKSVNRVSLAPMEKATKVTWTLRGGMSYFERYFAPMMDSMLGKDFEGGLKNLKEYIERK